MITYISEQPACWKPSKQWTYPPKTAKNMDSVTDEFGKLSTAAREWTPGSSSSTTAKPSKNAWQQQDAASDLTASGVKEFVPGKGWTTTTPTGAATKQQQQGKGWSI